jgi:hypothetical protein
MNTPINFEDNIFIISGRIRMIRDLLILDVEPDFFLEKTLDDIDFINHTLGVILDQLLKSERFIEREEQFHNLAETEGQFAEVLTELIRGKGTMAAAVFPVVAEKITLIRAQSAERLGIIEHSFTGTGGTVPESVVSPDELQELLKDLD